MKIAIVKLSALGDIVHAMVALQFIKAEFEDAEIDWIVEARFAEILRYNPHIEHIRCVNLKALKQNKKMLCSEIRKIKAYAKHHYDLVIDAQGLIKSAVTAKLLGKKIAGFDKHSIREKPASWFYDLHVNYPYAANTIDRNVGVISNALGFQVTAQQIQDKQAFLFFENADKSIDQYFATKQKTIIFIVGSTWESRNYPKHKFFAIAEALKQNCLVVWGSENERQIALWLAERSEYITMLPKIDLNTLKAVIAKSALLIGNDTGPTHMAWGLNRASITLFGPTPVSRVYQTAINKVVKSASKVNPLKLDKNDFSIREIDERSIIEIAHSLL